MRSRIYTGRLRHRRTGPRAYQFTYGVFYCSIDLDEIEEVDRRIRLLSYNRRNVLSFLDRDHMGAPGEGIRAAVHAHLARAGVDPDEGSISILTNTRAFGYVFNPVSFYLVRDAGGAIRHAIAEVHNTHGERHVYDLPAADSCDGVYRSAVGKEFYVSPFIDMEGDYAFELRERGGRLDIRIDESRDGKVFFQAQLDLAEGPMTNVRVLKMLARFPLMTLRTIGLIHWQGLKLWLRGEPYRKHKPKVEARR